MVMQLFLLKEMIAELIFWYMSKNEKEMLIRNADLTEEKWKIIKHEK